MAVTMMGGYPTKFCMIWDVTGRAQQFCDFIWRRLENDRPPTPPLSYCLGCRYDGWCSSSHKEHGHSSDTARCYENDTPFCLVQTSVNSQYIWRWRLTFALLWKESSSKHSFLRSTSKSLETLGGSSLAILKCPPVSLESISSTSKFFDGARSPISHVTCLLLSLEETGSVLNH